MTADLPKVTVPVQDRILLHLLEQDEHADRFVAPGHLTRDGIAEACALHPPNVSRAMRTLLRDARVSEHLRTIEGEERRRKVWQLTDTGRRAAQERRRALRDTPVLVRDQDGTLLELPAREVDERLDADIGLLRTLMHAQHEGVLTYGDIRFGLIRRARDGAGASPPPGRLRMMAGAHATYDTAARKVARHGAREDGRPSAQALTPGTKNGVPALWCTASPASGSPPSSPTGLAD